MDIRAATDAERAVATERVFREGPAAGEFLRLIASGDVDAADLLVAVDATGVCGGMVAQPLPGHLGVVAPPSADDPAIADALVLAAIAHLEKNHVRLVQAYLDADADPVALEHGGFRFVTRIEHRRLASIKSGGTASPCGIGQGDAVPPLSGIVFDKAFDPALFAATLVATHEGSLDAPEANIGATAEEIDSGYAATCERWLAVEDEQPVGVLILSKTMTTGEIEYFGVVPAARGRGVGAAILHHAMDSFRNRGLTNVSVAVDERNIPARKLYDRLGFQPFRVENLWLRKLA